MTIYRPKGRKTYMMDFMFKSHRVYKTTGETNKKRAEKVEEAYRDALKDGARGLWSKERPHLLGAAAEEWRTKPRKNPWSKSTEAIVADTLGRVLAHFGKDSLLAEIEAEDIANYQLDRLAEERRPSNRTVNMDVITLRKVLIHAGHWPRLRDGIHMLKERDDVGKALTPGQERPLLEECGSSVSRALLPFVTLAIDTGARYDTIRTLQWERVDLRRGVIKIGKDKTKAGTGRVVPLNARALRTLQFWAAQFPDREPQHFVFPTTRFGLHGRKGQMGKGGEVKAYDTDPKRPVGTIQQAWEAAKRRTQLHCPACEAGRLMERKPAKRKSGVAVEPPPSGWVCQGCG
jgi:integrase